MTIHFQALFKEKPPKGKGVSFGYPTLTIKGNELQRNEKFFSALGVEIDFFDIKAHFGVEKFMDLNKPILSSLFQKYDFLINPGTYEHCFNVAQAMQNGYDILKPRGISYHTAPIARGKHGFWNFNEITFNSFYRHHGGRILSQKIENGSLFVIALNGKGKASLPFPYEEKKYG